MFILGKILSRLLISPAFFILTILVAGVLINRFNFEKVKRFLIIISILFYVISIRPTKELLVRILEPLEVSSYTELTSTQAYVLLGGGITEGTPRGDIPSDPAYPRIVETAILYNRSPKKIFITGGRVYKGRASSESSVYREYLMALGIPGKDILIEEESRNTFENALFTKKLLDEYDIESITLVTSATHMFRSKQVFASTGLEVTEAPCGFLANNSSYKIVDFIPDSNNLNFFFRALWEYIGVTYYQLRLLISPLS